MLQSCEKCRDALRLRQVSAMPFSGEQKNSGSFDGELTGNAAAAPVSCLFLMGRTVHAARESEVTGGVNCA